MRLDEYSEYLNRIPVSDHTRRNYKLRVKQFLKWNEGTIDGDRVFSNKAERDFAVKDYRAHLLQRGAKPATVNAHLAALDNFFLFIGLGPAKARRHDLPALAPKALSKDEQNKLLRAINRCESIRNKTICMILYHTGLRISELSALDVRDVFVTARKGEITVRCGKNDKQRRIPISAELRDVMKEYLSRPRDPYEPLFKSQKGNRISTSAVDYVVHELAKDAGIEMSAHTLRHSFLTRLLRSGSDVVLVAEIAGHSRLETTRRYSLPCENDKIEAIERASSYAASS